VTRPWETLESVETAEGRLELRRRGDRDFVITVGGRVLMNSALHLTEAALADMACGRIAGRDRPHVLVGGLGMGFTLRAALDALPRKASVVVAGRAVDDARVAIRIDDVAQVIAEAAAPRRPRFDAIVLDLYEGPRQAVQAQDDPLYGRRALETARAALVPGGVFAVWSEDADPAFAKRLRAAGFAVETRRPGKGGPRHVIYLGRSSGPLGG
jgi:spermidine synthase